MKNKFTLNIIVVSLLLFFNSSLLQAQCTFVKSGAWSGAAGAGEPRTNTIINADSDGDGIADIDDLDDDNDGILDTVECAWPVVNGSFESPVIPLSGTPYIENIGSVNGWTTVSGSFDLHTVGTNNASVGNQCIDLQTSEGDPLGVIQQVFNVGAPGMPYTFTIDYGAVNSGASANVIVGGNIVATLVDNSPAPNSYQPLQISWQTFTYSGISTGNSVTIRFASVSTNTGLPYWGMFLDNFKFAACFDTDGDGILNPLDTDSDNDGCPDATEGANNYTTTATLTGGSNGGSSGNLGTTVNANGIPIPPGTVGGSTGQATTTGVLTPVRINAGTTPPVAVSGTVGTTVNLTSNATAESATTWATTTPFAPNYTTLGNATSGLTYSWTKNGTTIAGATSATLSLTNVSLADAGTYEVTIKHSGNYCATTSNSTVFTLAICYNDAATGTAGVDTKHGITLLQRAGADNGNWPMIRKSAHTVLESNTKGFVITRATTAQIGLIVSPQDGMMVYDTDAKCLKIYTVDDVTPANSAWSCFSTPTCP